MSVPCNLLRSELAVNGRNGRGEEVLSTAVNDKFYKEISIKSYAGNRGLRTDVEGESLRAVERVGTRDGTGSVLSRTSNTTDDGVNTRTNKVSVRFAQCWPQ